MSTLETNLIQPATGTTLTVGASGDTIDIPSGATLDAAGATITGALANAPYIRVKCATQAISATTSTVLQFNNEVYDSESSFDTSTYRWTPQVAGTYFIGINMYVSSMNDANYAEITIQKNGSNIGNVQYTCAKSSTSAGVYIGTITELNGSTDYVDGSAYLESAETMNGNAHIIGYRLI